MDCVGCHRPILWNAWKFNMTILTLEENQILENDEAIPDLSTFLKRLPSKTEITLILKTHDVLYHLCPIRKAVPYLKSAEYSSDYWVGERRLPNGHTFIGGVLASPFMRTMIKVIAEHSFAVKGVFLWTDLITQAYGPFLQGWTLIWHNHHLLICQDGILRISRSCYLPLVQELPAIIRYLKRFGYQEEMPITLLKSSIFPDTLPPFIHPEIRIPNDLTVKGLTLQIPELTSGHRLYTWQRKIRAAAYALTLLNTIGITHFGWQIKSASEIERTLKQQINEVPTKNLADETKMEAFAAYCRLSKDRPNLLSILRQLIPLMKEEAVATHLHWTANPPTLTLHLELQSSTEAGQFLLTLRSQFRNHRLTWQAAEDEPLKGTLTIEKQIPDKQES